MASTRARRCGDACLAIFLLLPLTGPASADADTDAMQHDAHASHAAHSGRPDQHAPIGVMGDHTHGAGDVMLSYRYSRMSMRGNRDGTGRVSTSAVLRDYPVSPTSMSMEMHMFGAMWAPSDKLTLMAMLPFQRLSMKHRTRMGRSFTTRAHGIGDVKLWGLVPLWAREGHELHLNAGLSVPTGSTSVKDDTPLGRQRLPYPMQLGSGTWDLLPGLTYNGRAGDTTFGAQGLGTIRTSRNSRDYRLGHAYRLNGWLAREFLPWLSTSLRLEWNDWGNLKGDDDGLNPRVVPTADPDLRGGRRLDLLLGVNLLGTGGAVKGHRLALEIGRPIYQNLDGPQLEVDWRVMGGWQYAF